MSFDPVWEQIFKSQAWGKYPCEDLIRFVARNFYSAPDRGAVKILEVGCGPGANLWYMAREGFAVYGVDCSETAIQQAKARLDLECPGWKGGLFVGDIGKLQFDDGFFDAAIDNEAIYANPIEDSVNMYAELSRVCKEGAKLYSRTFASGSWGDGTGSRVGHNSWLVGEGMLHNKGYSRFTSLEEIPAMVSGFRINEIELLTRTQDGRTHEVKEWLILGEKAE